MPISGNRTITRGNHKTLFQRKSLQILQKMVRKQVRKDHQQSQTFKIIRFWSFFFGSEKNINLADIF